MLPDGLLDHVTAEIEGAQPVAQILLTAGGGGIGAQLLGQTGHVLQRVLFGAQHVQLLLGEVADVQALALGDLAAQGRCMVRAMVLTSVDLPWPLAPRMPMRWPASTERLTPRRIDGYRCRLRRV